MKYLLIGAFLLFLNSSYSQVIVEGVNINELEDVVYCQVIATGKLFTKKVKINIDYGQESKFFGKQNSSVKDAEGKDIKFNSVFAAVNYLGTNGWKFVHAYPVTIGNVNVYHYTFERDGVFGAK